MTSKVVISVDVKSSRRRRARFQAYVRSNLLDDDVFICPHYRECRRSRLPSDVFREGTMSHVGRRFDLMRDGRPLRIAIAGQESGWAQVPRFRRRVSVDVRYGAVHDRSGLQRRYFSDPTHAARNPHMRGTTSVLRVLLGGGVGADHASEWVRPAGGRPFHLFDGFALLNRLLCSAGPKGSSVGHPTSTMFDNCAEHFGSSLAILEPTILVIQGVLVAKKVASVIDDRRQIRPHLEEVQIGGRQLLMCSFSHPAAHGELRWGDSLARPYLNEVVVPTLREALRRSPPPG